MLRAPLGAHRGELHLQPKKLTFYALGAKKLLTARTKDAAQLTARSSDPGIASVAPQTAATSQAGLTAQFTITAHALGTASISVSDASGASVAADVSVAATGTWLVQKPMPTARYDFAAAIIDRCLYAAGGFGAGTSGVLEIYDLDGRSWSTGAQMPSPRTAAMSGAIRHTLYVAGGMYLDASGSQNILGTMDAYETQSRTWSAKTSLPERRYVGGAVVVGETLYVLGGKSAPPEELLGSVLAYAPGADAWTQVATMPVPRSNIAVAAIGTSIYIAGGHDGTRYVDTVDIFDTQTKRWTTAAPLPSPRGAATAAVIDGILYVAGGLAIDNTHLSEVHAYDAPTNTWSRQLPMPIAAQNRALVASKSTLYALGGWNGNPLNEFETFEP